MPVVGEAWSCPHCGGRILRSAASCPSCQRRLRFDAATSPRPAQPTICPLSIEGVIRHPGNETPWEYSVLVQVQNAEGETLDRRVVGVGAIRPGETRTFTLRVEMRIPEKSTQPAASSRPPITEEGKQKETPARGSTRDRQA